MITIFCNLQCKFGCLCFMNKVHSYDQNDIFKNNMIYGCDGSSLLLKMIE